MKRLAAVVVALLATLVMSGVAVAKGNSPTNAQAAGDAFVTSMLPTPDGQPGLCDVKTQSGFFASGASYLASCATNDGTFQAFFITGAKNGSLHTKSQYVGAQLSNFCAAGGHAYSVGVKEKLAAVYAGTSAEAPIAKGLRDALAGNIKKSTPGYVKPFTLC